MQKRYSRINRRRLLKFTHIYPIKWSHVVYFFRKGTILCDCVCVPCMRWSLFPHPGWGRKKLGRAGAWGRSTAGRVGIPASRVWMKAGCCGQSANSFNKRNVSTHSDHSSWYMLVLLSQVWPSWVFLSGTDITEMVEVQISCWNMWWQQLSVGLTNTLTGWRRRQTATKRRAMVWANNGVVEPLLSTSEHWQYLAALKLPGTRQLQLCTGRGKAKVAPKPPPRNTKRTGAWGIIGGPVEALMAQEITPPSFGLNTLHGLILNGSSVAVGPPGTGRIWTATPDWVLLIREIPEPELFGVDVQIVRISIRPVLQSLGAPVEWESPLKQWRCRLAQSRQNEIVSICFNYCAETNPQVFFLLRNSFWRSYLLICPITLHISRTWCGNRNWLLQNNLKKQLQFYQHELISFCTRTYRPTVKCSRLPGGKNMYQIKICKKVSFYRGQFVVSI